MTPEEKPQSISGDRLALLTGLTDRRHRQIAKMGYFPPPEDGSYQLTPTLQGMFKYYRELDARKSVKRESIDEEKHRKLKLENDATAGSLVERQAVFDSLSASLIPIREALRHKFEQELPLAMSGMELPVCRIFGRKAYDEAIERIKLVFLGWKI